MSSMVAMFGVFRDQNEVSIEVQAMRAGNERKELNERRRKIIISKSIAAASEADATS